ncbi:MAG: hypothetical protein HY673_16695 [Chloroflexi bacterium]|nr:hypothetical protein [Chloroflexota bacterium]
MVRQIIPLWQVEFDPLHAAVDDEGEDDEVDGEVPGTRGWSWVGARAVLDFQPLCV